MVFWIAAAVLAAAVTYAVTRPLMVPREPQSSDDAAAADLAVYKDQLAEIETDKARGILSAEEAEAARTEVARRLIRRSEQADLTKQSDPRATAVSIKPVLMAASLAIPVLSLALYLSVGAPGLPGMPLAERLAARPNPSNENDLIAKVEARLRDHPEDGKGWDVIAPVYLQRGQFNDAVQAYANALRILGETPARLNGFAEAKIRADDGIVGEDARKALQGVLKADPKQRGPRIWLAIAKEQDGDKKGAADDYRALIAEVEDGTPFRKMLEDRLAFVEGRTTPAPQKSAAQKGNEPSPEDQAAMINKMVDGLAERLKTNGKDAEGWARLIRAYSVLGRKEDAAKALSDARGQLAGDDAGLKSVNAVATELGVSG